MKKILLTLLAGASLGTTGSAQGPITLNWKDYGRFPPSDTVSMVNDLLPLANIRNSATNAFWDLTGLSYGFQEVIYRDSIQVANSGGAEGFVYRQGEKMSLGNIKYSGSVQLMRDTFSIGVTGRDIGPHTISLNSVTGVATDMLYVPQQTVNTGTQELVLKFPASMDSTWTSTSQYPISYELTVAAAQYNNKPFTRDITKQVTGTVIGWGKARISDPVTGRPSDAMDVLQVEVIEVTNSQYSGGVDPVILNALNLQSGSSDTVSSIWLMRKGETTPLLSVRYNGVPSSTPEEALVHINRITVPTAVTTVATADAVKVYPNPVRRGGVLFVDGEGAGNWQLRLSSMTGQQVHEVRWNQSQSHPQAVQIPQNLAEGLYIFQMTQNGQPVKTGRIWVSE